MKYDKSLLEVMQWKPEVAAVLNQLTLAERLAFFQSPAKPETKPTQVGNTVEIPNFRTQELETRYHGKVGNNKAVAHPTITSK